MRLAADGRTGTVLVRVAAVVRLPLTDAAIVLTSARAAREPYPFAGPYAVRNRSRKESIGQTGASGPGNIPGCQPQEEIRSRTRGSELITLMGTSCVGSDPLTMIAG